VKKLSEKVITPVKLVLPLSNVSLTDECIFSAPELAIGDQPMISLKYIGLTNEHCWLEFRKILSVGMNRCLQLYHRFK
jgi:hypothetical protein